MTQTKVFVLLVHQGTLSLHLPYTRIDTHISENLWICLVCAHVGCGRYISGHARVHFEETGHVYSLELQSQRVWDYVGDGYFF